MLGGVTGATGAEAPRTFLLSAPALAAARARFASAPAPAALRRLLADAERALTLPPPSVMDKPLRAASGDPHDRFAATAPLDSREHLFAPPEPSANTPPACGRDPGGLGRIGRAIRVAARPTGGSASDAANV